MDTSTTQSRDTKYCRAIRHYMQRAGHATNQEILVALQDEFPNVTATTIHRATARLAARDELRVAPADLQGAMRYDVRTSDHDHVLCEKCGRLRDIMIADQVRPLIEQQLEGCRISGRMTIAGTCNQCL